MTDVEPLQQFPGYDMDMPVHYECVAVERRCLAKGRSNRQKGEDSDPDDHYLELTRRSDFREYGAPGLELSQGKRSVSVLGKGEILANEPY